jgi:hypothetical protein
MGAHLNDRNGIQNWTFDSLTSDDEEYKKRKEEEKSSDGPPESKCKKMRTWLITGATDGIGLVTARLLARFAPRVSDNS